MASDFSTDALPWQSIILLVPASRANPNTTPLCLAKSGSKTLRYVAAGVAAIPALGAEAGGVG